MINNNNNTVLSVLHNTSDIAGFSKEKLAELFGESLAVCKNFDQKNAHHDLTLLDHMIKVAEYYDAHIEEDLDLQLQLKIAALLHDIGKPVVQKDLGTHCTYIGHGNESAKLAWPILKNLDFSDKVTNFICNFLIKHHDSFMCFKFDNEMPKNGNPFFKSISVKNVYTKIVEIYKDCLTNNIRLNSDHFKTLLTFSIADSNAQAEEIRINNKLVDTKLNKIARYNYIITIIDSIRPIIDR